VAHTVKRRSAALLGRLLRREITDREFFRSADELSDGELRSLAAMLRKLATLQKVKNSTNRKAG
jgi:hypothetical protein